jgi:hypothetical protein
MKDLKIISGDKLHNSIRSFIIESETIIGDYEDMKSLILNMIKSGYMFNMNRDRLRDGMEDLTYMLCPSDDANQDRVERGLEYDDEVDSDDSDDLEFSESGGSVGEDRQERLEKKTDQDDTVEGDTIEDIEDIGNTKDLN